MKLSKGSNITPFKLPLNGGGKIDIGSKRENAICLFCYPKDDTSGCTTEAIEFTARAKDFAKLGIEIYGISPDSVKRHDKFITKHDLGIPLISDEEKTTLQSLGVWVEKSMYGRKYMGVERSTFLISPDNEILACWRKVKVPGHVEEVLAIARELFG